MSELTREQKIKLIYRETPKDYRGKDGEHHTVMPPFNIYNKTCLVTLETLPDDRLDEILAAKGLPHDRTNRKLDRI